MLSTLKGWVVKLPPHTSDSPLNLAGAVRVPSIGVELDPAAVLARKAAEECKRADHALKDAFRLLDSRMFPDKKETNRPRNIDKAAEMLVSASSHLLFSKNATGT